MNANLLITVDYSTFKFANVGYQNNIENPPLIERKLGRVAYWAQVIRLSEPWKINREFPLPREAMGFELAGPVLTAVFRLAHPGFQKDFSIFGIGSSRSIIKEGIKKIKEGEKNSIEEPVNGLFVAYLPRGENFGRDLYLPAWVVDDIMIPVPRGEKQSTMQGVYDTLGFPAGTGFLVISKQP